MRNALKWQYLLVVGVKPFPANQKVKHESFHWAIKYSILLAGNVRNDFMPCNQFCITFNISICKKKCNMGEVDEHFVTISVIANGVISFDVMQTMTFIQCQACRLMVQRDLYAEHVDLRGIPKQFEFAANASCHRTIMFAISTLLFLLVIVWLNSIQVDYDSGSGKI